MALVRERRSLSPEDWKARKERVQVDRWLRAFHGRVAKRGPDECWEWTGQRDRRGYGRVSRGNRKHAAHRVALELAMGVTFPSGVFVCHRCDNPPCCNPAHLFTGDHTDNMRDMARKGRHVGAARLTDEQVAAIRARRAEGALLRELADAFGISLSYAGYLTRGDNRTTPKVLVR